MPRDEWTRSANRYRFGPSPERRTRAERRKNRKALLDGKVAPVFVVPSKRRSFEFSPTTRLWFGQYKGRKLTDVPRDYLQWLLETNEPGKFIRMDQLCDYLRGRLHRL